MPVDYFEMVMSKYKEMMDKLNKEAKKK